MTEFVQHQGIMILRLIIACICGVVIGFERKNRAKEAGIRTHCVVACGAALMMIISKYGFGDLEVLYGTGTKTADPARIAAQIISGVGFLGAGTIFVQKNTIKGLTTAAGLWATAGIGMAIGAGMYIIGVATTFIILVAQILLHSRAPWFTTHVTKTLSVYNVPVRDYGKYIRGMLNNMGVAVYDARVTQSKSEGTKDYKFVIDIPPTVDEEDILNAIAYDAKVGGNI